MKNYFWYAVGGIFLISGIIIVSFIMTNEPTEPATSPENNNEAEEIPSTGTTTPPDRDIETPNPPITKPPQTTPPPATTKCYVGGCSGQLCSNNPDGLASTCEWREEYACYREATCEVQPSGQCGWTPTAELNACLAN